MSKMGFAAILALALAFCGSAEAASRAQSRTAPDTSGIDYKAANEALMRELDWINALTMQDAKALGEILADEFTYKDETGKTYNKAQYIVYATKTMKFNYGGINQITPSGGGDRVTLAGRWNANRTLNGKEASGEFAATDTWVKRAGRWQVLSAERSR